MANKTFSSAEQLVAAIGQPLGETEWLTVTQERVNLFADATDDHQWIHVDAVKAKDGPFGAPIAHGYLTLALVAGQFFELLDLQGFKMIINYGCGKVRFPSPMKENASWRLSMKLGEVKDVGGGWLEAPFLATIEIEGSAKPGCVAECIYRFLPE